MFFFCMFGSSFRVPETTVSVHSHHHCSPDMVAKLKKILGTVNPEDVNIVDVDVDEMQELLKKIIMNIRGAEEAAVPEPGEADDDKDLIQAISMFGGKHTIKPSPCNGEDEKAFKSWTEKFTMYMSNANDKIWRSILKKIQSLSNDADLEDEKKASSSPLASTRGCRGGSGEHVRPVGPVHRRRAVERCTYRSQARASVWLQEGSPRGKEEDCREIHRARTRLSRSAITENMDVLEGKFKKLKKDIASLKDIDAYEHRDNGIISILLDFVPTLSTRRSQ